METIALENGRAMVDLSDHRTLTVSGSDAAGWLNDLVTANVTTMTPGRARGSFLLDPTGHIRAQFIVVRTWREFLLIQDPIQPDPLGELLSKYILSSDVVLTEEAACLFAVPAGEYPAASWSASPALREHGGGTYLGAAAELHDELSSLLSTNLIPASRASLEAFRISLGIPRYPVDLGPGSIPAEAPDMERELIDPEKGCFLGQESVARTRNLGRPPSLVVALRTNADVSVGEPVTVEGKNVGKLTSVASDPAGTSAIARVRWFEGGQPRFRTGHGHPFTLRHGRR